MKILSEARKRTFDSIPKLSKDARAGYFTLDKQTRNICNKMQSDNAKIGFLVQKAYFQAKGRFFDVARFANNDIKRAQKAIGKSTSFDAGHYSAEIASRHKKQILAQFEWRPYKNDTAALLSLHANSLVAVRMHKEDILFALVSYCWKRRVEIPSYFQLSDIVAAAFREMKKLSLIK